MSKLASRQSTKLQYCLVWVKSVNVDFCLKSIDFEDKFSHDNRSVFKTTC